MKLPSNSRFHFRYFFSLVRAACSVYLNVMEVGNKSETITAQSDPLCAYEKLHESP